MAPQAALVGAFFFPVALAGGATNMELAGARFLAGCWKFKVGSQQF
jgi:hypothetical protein